MVRHPYGSAYSTSDGNHETTSQERKWILLASFFAITAFLAVLPYALDAPEEHAA